MNNLEQRIWDYLDRTCSEQERKEIESLIESDSDCRAIYMELKSVDHDFSKLEMDEPSMGFTRNVMERVKLEPFPGTFKSLIDKRIIYGIAGFFLVTIAVLLGVLLSQLDWSQPMTQVVPQYKIPEINLSGYLNSAIIDSFLFVDTILALYLLDSFLRKQMHLKSGRK